VRYADRHQRTGKCHDRGARGPETRRGGGRRFRATLLGLIEGGKDNLIVNLDGVDFIDSSGLGALVSALKHLKQSGRHGDIRLAHVKPPVESVLEIIRLHRVFSRYGSVDEAVKSFPAMDEAVKS